MELTGILKAKFPEQQVSEKFRKREFVLTDNSSQYPQHISFQLTQDKCSLVENINIGDQVKVLFNIRGREWVNKDGETKYFNSLEAWKLELVAVGASSAAPSAAPANNGMNNNAATGVTFGNSSAEDDLPF